MCVGAVRLLLVALCVISLSAQTTKVALMSDVHAFCGATDNSGKGDSNNCDANHRGMWTQVRANTPDYIAISGDLSNYGNVSEYQKGVWATSATSVTAGNGRVITAAAAPGNGNFFIFGTDTYTGGPFAPTNTKWAAIEEETPANFELAQVTAVAADGTTATINFAKAHTAPFTVRIADLGPIQDYVYAGQVGATIGNHDVGAQDLPICTNTGEYAWGVACPGSWTYSEEFTSLATVFSDTVGATAGVPAGRNQTGGWWTKEVGTSGAKVTLIGARWDNTNYGGTQELALHSTLASCPSRWCVALVHALPLGNTVCGAGNTGTTNQKWVAQAGVNLVSGGHCHAYARITAADYAGTRNIPWLVNGWGSGTSGDTITPGDCTDCTVESYYSGPSNINGFTLVTATRRNLSIQAIDHEGTVRDAATVATKTRMFPMPGFANR